MEGAISDQLERFDELYGQPPTHLDGHNHVHVSPNVALAAPLKSIGKVRDSLWAWPSARTVGGAAQALRRALVSRRFLRTQYFLHILQLHREMDLDERRERIGLSRGTSVEVMAHPGYPHEQGYLMSEDWGRLMETETLPLGSYRDLA